MSSYEQYDKTAAHYDSTRWPIGVEIIVGCLAQGRVPLAEMTVLDAGCGTGNYARALLPKVARIEALDRSTGMLEVAARKLADAVTDGRVVLHRGSIEALPLADAAVDGIMINQVLHHLPDEPEAGWPAHRRVFGECARVLRPGGVLVINSCTAHQVERGFWPVHLIPEAGAEIVRRLMRSLRSRRRLARAASSRAAGSCRWTPWSRVPTTSIRAGRSGRNGAPGTRSGRW